MEIKIIKKSILDLKVDAIVNPANSLGTMGGGLAFVIKREGGKEIEEEAIKKAPIQVGEAILTTAGNLNFKGIIHAPTMEKPATKTTTEKIKKATIAALSLADRSGFKSIAIPGMGTGVGSLDFKEAAQAMKEAIESIDFKNLEKIYLVDINKDMILAWKETFKSFLGEN